MPVCQKFNVGNKEYTIIPVISKSMEKDSLELIANSTVKQILNLIDSLTLAAQNKRLSAYINYSSTVEDFLVQFCMMRARSGEEVTQANAASLMTGIAAYLDKRDYVEFGSTKNFTAYGAWRYFDGCTTPLEWLRHVFGSDYEQKLARGYFVD